MRRLLALAALMCAAACPEGRPEALPRSASVIDAGASAKASPAKLIAITGAATVTRGGAVTKAKPQDLALDDVVETGPDGDGTIRFIDGHEVQIGPDGRFEITSGTDGLVLSVGQGVIVSRTVGDLSLDDGRLSILTPYGLVRLADGSVKIGVGKDEATLDVLTGNVRIISRGGGEDLTVNAGDISVLSREGVKPGTRTVRLEPLQFEIGAITGRVEYRTKDAKAFTQVTAKKLPALQTGDVLRVTAGSATMVAKSSAAKLVVGSNSEVGIGAVQTGSGLEDVALDLRKGAVVITMPVGTKRKLHPGDGYTLSVDNGAQFSVTRSKTGLELNTVVGEIVVEHDSMSPVTLHGSQLAKLTTNGGVTTVDLAKETLTLPSRSYRLFHPNVGSAALGWEGEVGTPFHITVGNEPTLANPIIDGITKQPWLNVKVPARGSIFWRVTVDDKQIARGSVACAPERAAGELSRLRNDVPEGAEKTVIYYQDKPPSVTFVWKAGATAAAEYKLQVYREGDFTKPIEERTTKTTTLQLPENALGEGNYAWSVTPLDAKGKPLAGGRMTKLEMVYDNAVTEVVIKSPRNGDPNGATVRAVGIAPFKTRVSANGQLLPLDDKARFDSTVVPVGGRVVFRTVGEGGEQLIVRQLRRGK